MEIENLTMTQLDALLECAEALKEIVNAAGNGHPYNKTELTDLFAPHLSKLSATGIQLEGEC
jgi:hypothetical protein